MACEALTGHDLDVELYDAMPSVGRKFLLAGIGGLNLTHSEPYASFVTRYGSARSQVEPWLGAFGPEALREWAMALGVDTFVGTSGRVFPKDMKAAPLLRAWLHRLREAGVQVHARHRWIGWADAGADADAEAEGAGGSATTSKRLVLRFLAGSGGSEILVEADAVVLALGGGSWPRLGSDGAWVPLLEQQGAEVAPLRPANCGFDVGWSEHFKSRFAGQPVKPVAIRLTESSGAEDRRQGEFVVTETGVEGSLVYAYSAALRDAIEAKGVVTVELDLLPAHTLDKVIEEVSRPRGPRSLSTHLKSRLGLQGVKAGLLWELLPDEQQRDPLALAQRHQGAAAAPRRAAAALRGHQHGGRRPLRLYERGRHVAEPAGRVLPQARWSTGKRRPAATCSAPAWPTAGMSGRPWRSGSVKRAASALERARLRAPRRSGLELRAGDRRQSVASGATGVVDKIGTNTRHRSTRRTTTTRITSIARLP